MNIERIDHTGVAVYDLSESLERYRQLFGVDVSSRAVVAEQEVEVAFLAFGGTQIELIQPLTTTSGVARFLQRRGEGLHHIALEVDDLKAELDRLDSLGIELIDRYPRRGLHGSIAFVHPRGTGGVLLELVEHDHPQSPY